MSIRFEHCFIPNHFGFNVNLTWGVFGHRKFVCLYLLFLNLEFKITLDRGNNEKK